MLWNALYRGQPVCFAQLRTSDEMGAPPDPPDPVVRLGRE